VFRTVRPSNILIAVALGFVLAGCSGGFLAPSAGSLPNVGNDGVRTVSDAADALDGQRSTASQNATLAIGATDAFGSLVGGFSEDEETRTALRLSGNAEQRAQRASGCEEGVDFSAPDRYRDPRSDETLLYYDGRCHDLARDVMRRSAPSGPNSETIRESTALFFPGSSAEVASRSETLRIADATFGRNGPTPLRAGLEFSTSSRLATASGKQAASDSAVVMLPSQGNVTDYCQQSAGYSLTGIPSLDATFGWQTAAFSEVARATDGHGMATWSATENGETFQAPIGSLAIAQSAVEPACPMTATKFSVTGVTANRSAFSIPISVTFRRGLLESISVAHAKVGNETLDVTTTANRPRADGDYVRGDIKGDRTELATFHTDGFGDGTLTITSTGAQYVIADWIVVGI
jgi:hypothetical protein